MNDTMEPSSRPSRGWLTFAAGVAVGLTLGALVVAGTVAKQRRDRRGLPWSRQRWAPSAPLGAKASSESGADMAPDHWGDEGMRAARHWPEDAELDEELEQTFPASDPLPFSHRVD